jgi:hypothetical protein
LRAEAENRRNGRAPPASALSRDRGSRQAGTGPWPAHGGRRDVGRGVVARHRHAEPLGAADQFHDVVLAGPGPDVPIDLGAAPAALQGVVKRLVRRPGGMAHQFDHRGPLAFLQCQDLDEAVAAFEHAAIFEGALDPVFERTVAEPLHSKTGNGQAGILNRDVGGLALAGPQRRERGEGGRDAALHGGEMPVDLQRRAIGEQLHRQPVG